jgi:hypothetical protein
MRRNERSRIRYVKDLNCTNKKSGGKHRKAFKKDYREERNSWERMAEKEGPNLTDKDKKLQE